MRVVAGTRLLLAALGAYKAALIAGCAAFQVGSLPAFIACCLGHVVGVLSDCNVEQYVKTRGGISASAFRSLRWLTRPPASARSEDLRASLTERSEAISYDTRAERRDCRIGTLLATTCSGLQQPLMEEFSEGRSPNSRLVWRWTWLPDCAPSSVRKRGIAHIPRRRVCCACGAYRTQATPRTQLFSHRQIRWLPPRRRLVRF